MISKPLVSIIIPTYNRSNLLLKAIESVLEQTYSNFELLIVDDNSKDNTFEVIKNINDNRLKYIKLETNMGGSFARNKGIKESTGDFIAFLDSDDKWTNSKLEKQMNIFKDNKEVGVVYSGIIINSENNARDKVIFTPKEQGDILHQLLKSNCVGTTSAVIVKSELIKKEMGFDASLPSCQDWDLWIRLAKITKYGFVNEPMVEYFEHNGDRITTNYSAVAKGHEIIYHKYRDLIDKELSKKDANSFYSYMGFIFLKIAILTQDKLQIRKGRDFIKKGIKLKPINLRSHLYLITSFINVNFLHYIYLSREKLRK